MRLIRNYEIKIITTSLIIAFVIFSSLFLFIIDRWFQESSVKYARQNIALAGAILKSNPELEEKIIPIVTKGNVEQFYEEGSEILAKYYYTDTISAIKNPLLEIRYREFKIVCIGVFMFFLFIILFIVLKGISPLYKNLRYLSNIADNMVEGNFKNKMIYLNEGDLSIFYNKFTDMGERLESALEQLKEERINLKNIISDISHQLKTPLAALITYNDIIKNQNIEVNDERNRFIDLSSEQLDRMEWLITILLKYARLEGNVVQYNKSISSLKNTIYIAIEPLKVKALEKHQNIIVESFGEGIYWHDEKWIAEALSNIIKNAIEHTGAYGEINIKLEETPVSISISIKDNGEGIEKNELKKIFRRFYKGQNSINPTSIGIGLSLSKKIVEAHDGSIVADSKIGKGSTFLITFLKGVV